MNCAYCNTLLFPDDRSCPKCGAPNESRKGVEVKKEIYEALTEKTMPRTEVKSSPGNQLLYTYYHDVEKEERDYYEKWKDADWGVYQEDWNEFAKQFQEQK